MLTPDELKEALHDALKDAQPPCTRFCRAGITLVDGYYEAFHNGTGPVKGDHQVIVADAPLKFSQAQLSGRLKVWVEGQHRREFLDLNAALGATPGGTGPDQLTGRVRPGCAA
jgi:hypothetical protein